MAEPVLVSEFVRFVFCPVPGLALRGVKRLESPRALHPTPVPARWNHAMRSGIDGALWAPWGHGALSAPAALQC